MANSDFGLPPLFIRGLNFAGAMSRWLLAGFPRRDQRDIERVLDICSRCSFNINNTCQKCGCPLADKVSLATEKCPLGSW